MMQVTGKTLAGQRFLHGLQAGHLDALATAAAEVMFPAGFRIFAEGGYADKFWLVESGHVAVDMQVPGEGAAVIANVGLGGLLGWSWMLPSQKWAFGAVCVTEVKAYEFNALAVRERCAADPALSSELTMRLFKVLAGRLQDTRTTLISRWEDVSRYATP
ncbi:MAG TPA: cyclic nucleotide-binding domain-containing protein [Trebonia sp.]